MAAPRGRRYYPTSVTATGVVDAWLPEDTKITVTREEIDLARKFVSRNSNLTQEEHDEVLEILGILDPDTPQVIVAPE